MAAMTLEALQEVVAEFMELPSQARLAICIRDKDGNLQVISDQVENNCGRLTLLMEPKHD